MAINSTSWDTPQFPITLPSSSFDLGLKKKPIIECAINFTKQPYQQTLISKDTLEIPQPQPTPPPQWNPFQRALAMAIYTAERALVSLQNPLPKSVDPQVQLAGNFAPVPEQPVIPSLPIAGTIPDCINGVYLRNGPNLFFNPISGHHFFDGDDMVHAVTITGGVSSYACRFTETHRLLQERKLQRLVFPKPIGEIHGRAGIVRLMVFFLHGLFGFVDNRHGTGLANTGLVFFNNLPLPS